MRPTGPTGPPDVESTKLMKLFLLALFSLVLLPLAHAEERGTLIFEDDFERSESQEATDEIGKDWNSNSKARAKGHKQVDLKDGAMFIKLHAEADHAVSVTHAALFRDGSVEMRFMLENDQDSLGLDFADQKLKEVHAGHLFKVEFKAKSVSINDMKTGNMNLKYYDSKKAGTLTAEQKSKIATTVKRFPTKIEVGQWHTLVVTITGDTVTASVDGQETGRFTSVGFDHPSKRMLRIAVPKCAVVDDVKIWAKSPAVE